MGEDDNKEVKGRVKVLPVEEVGKDPILILPSTKKDKPEKRIEV